MGLHLGAHPISLPENQIAKESVDKGFVKNETVTCQLCNEEVKRSKFKKHAKNMHKGNTMSCPTCGDHVRGENHLKRHIEQMHNHDRAQELAQYVADGMVSEDKNAPKSDPLAQIEPIMLEERTKDRQIQVWPFTDFFCYCCKKTIDLPGGQVR